MGYRMVKFNVTPEENEQIDAVIKIPEETRSVFHGVVIDECNRPIHNAVVKLLTMDCNNKHLEPITHTFTDENGEFLFGPLCSHVKYVIKVWINHVKIREVVIKPDGGDEECLRREPCPKPKPPCEDERPCDEKHINGQAKFYSDECDEVDYHISSPKIRHRNQTKNWKNMHR